MAVNLETLPVQRAAELEVQPLEQSWLIQDLWGLAAVGIIGGAPKCCKSWLGLDIALSVGSTTPCPGCFRVPTPGTALVFLAEDSLPVRDLCAEKGLSHHARAPRCFSITAARAVVQVPGYATILARQCERARAVCRFTGPQTSVCIHAV